MRAFGNTQGEPIVKYHAFISYSHQDNLSVRGDGSEHHIQWANWLHEQLEVFRMPEDMEGKTNSNFEAIPDRITPIFRDEAELPTHYDLGGHIRNALDNSRRLLVIASPRSAASRYVNEEVRYFKSLGRGNDIITLIVDGEPNVRALPQHGWTHKDECFCPEIGSHAMPEGTNQRPALLQEPIAADARVKDGVKCREMTSIEMSTPACHEALEKAKLKIIAGIMGVSFDDLYNREVRRREKEIGERTARAHWLSDTFQVLVAQNFCQSINEAMFVGQYVRALDGNRRFTVPIEWRQQMKDRNHLHVMKAIEGKWLVAIPAEKAADPTGQAVLRSIGDDTVSGMMANMFADSSVVSWDKRGRLRIPDHLLHYARIDTNVTILGYLEVFHIWNTNDCTSDRTGNNTDIDLESAARALGLI